MQTLDKIAIIDFGSQYTPLIAKRIREIGALAEIKPAGFCVDELASDQFKGIILSGHPASSEEQINVDKRLLDLGIPVLGISYGMQLMNMIYQGSVKHLRGEEYGKQRVSMSSTNALFKGLKADQLVWMTHQNSIELLAPCFRPIAHSHDGMIAAIEHLDRKQYGVQFHPEVMHTQSGSKILENFLDVCACKKEWTVESQIEKIKEDIRAQVKQENVITIVSSEISSVVATLLCVDALGVDHVYPIHIDTGLSRGEESLEICQLLRNRGITNLNSIDASGSFLAAVKGVVRAEEKQDLVEELYKQFLARELAKVDADNTMFLCQGSLYSNLQEKCSDYVCVEPLAHLFKRELNRIAEGLSIPNHLICNYPLPKSGLATRVMGIVTPQQLETLRSVEKIYFDEVMQSGLYESISDAFAQLIPMEEGNIVVLQAFMHSDGGERSCFPFPMEILERISARLVKEVPTVVQVTYNI